ncbi:hypothetical protein [Sphingobacterium faecium]
MNTEVKNTTIKVSIEELDFMRKNRPKSFTTSICEALQTEGHKVNRVKVHQELTTLKDEYDERIIDAARRVLRAIKNVEFNPCQGEAG